MPDRPARAAERLSLVRQRETANPQSARVKLCDPTPRSFHRLLPEAPAAKKSRVRGPRSPERRLAARQVQFREQPSARRPRMAAATRSPSPSQAMAQGSFNRRSRRLAVFIFPRKSRGAHSNCGKRERLHAVARPGNRPAKRFRPSAAKAARGAACGGILNEFRRRNRLTLAHALRCKCGLTTSGRPQNSFAAPLHDEGRRVYEIARRVVSVL